MPCPRDAAALPLLIFARCHDAITRVDAYAAADADY